VGLSVILKIEKEEFNVLGFKYGFYRETDWKGYPTTHLLGGEIYNVMIESNEDTSILNYLSPVYSKGMKFSGGIEVCDAEGIKIRDLKWAEAWIYYYEEDFDILTNSPMIYTICIIPMRLDVNNIVRLDRRSTQSSNGFWEEYVQEPAPETVRAKPVEEETEEKKITKLYWVDAETGEVIKAMSANQKARLCFETKAYKKGEVVKAKVLTPSSILDAKWLNDKDKTIEKALVNAEVKIELTTENIDNDTKLQVLIKEKEGNVVKTLYTTVSDNKIKYDKLKIEEEWEDKILLIAVKDGVSEPFESSASLTVEPQFCDPLATMQIRMNKASNLFGKVRSEKGVANSNNHQGFDYYAASGTDIRAVSDGIVKDKVDPSSGDYGIQLTIKIDNSDYYAFYAHLSEIGSSIKVDSVVKKGDVIGKTGISGNASTFKNKEQHLHFECRTQLSLGKGLGGRTAPNSIVRTKFYSQDNAKDTDGNYTANQINTGVKKVEANGTETLMSVE
jgi:murein DD-endopeptidase MepM/ murein hydrolase activator NlpD